MASTTIQLLKGYLMPCLFMVASIAYHIQTAITSPKLLFTNFSAYRDLAFAKLLLAVGTDFAEDVPPDFGALLEVCRGRILDVGPGAGHQMYRFSRPDKIEAIYGVEPSVDMHASLREQANKAGLGEKYTILACGAQPESLIPALAKQGLLREDGDIGENGFDEIVCIRVLCGVPQLQETVTGLYRYLKPGGRFVICEHVVSDSQRGGSAGVRVLQQVYMALGWPILLGGCSLTRDTVTAFLNAAKSDGGWAESELKLKDERSALPHIVGYMVKKR
ncbi:S-adenosyl-L-methionine-dependent methyltransferase [Phaeosphaeriaceae sp. PMI808]|nr:S-adenosyl-L-methionine-dependent methyltransferase [Phaeosphaeriaceae sp. PMI808]